MPGFAPLPSSRSRSIRTISLGPGAQADADRHGIRCRRIRSVWQAGCIRRMMSGPFFSPRLRLPPCPRPTAALCPVSACSRSVLKSTPAAVPRPPAFAEYSLRFSPRSIRGRRSCCLTMKPCSIIIANPPAYAQVKLRSTSRSGPGNFSTVDRNTRAPRKKNANAAKGVRCRDREGRCSVRRVEGIVEGGSSAPLLRWKLVRLPCVDRGEV